MEATYKLITIAIPDKEIAVTMRSSNHPAGGSYLFKTLKEAELSHGEPPKVGL